LPVRSLRRYWRIGSDGAPEGPNWEMTFYPPEHPLGQGFALVALGTAVGA
jgi:hypothetical protein